MLCGASDYRLVPLPRTIQPVDRGVDIGVEKTARKGEALLTGHVYDTKFITVRTPITATVGGKPVTISPTDRLTPNLPTHDLKIAGGLTGDIFCDERQDFHAKGLFEYTNRMKPLRITHYPKICFIDSDMNRSLDHAFWFSGKLPKEGLSISEIAPMEYDFHELERETNNLLVNVKLAKVIGPSNSFMLSLDISNDNLYYDMNYFRSLKDGKVQQQGSMLWVSGKDNTYPYSTSHFLGSSITVSGASSSENRITYIINKNFDRQMFTYGNEQPMTIYIYRP